MAKKGKNRNIVRSDSTLGTVLVLVAEAAQSKTHSYTSTVSALLYFLGLLKAEICSQFSDVGSQMANCTVWSP